MKKTLSIVLALVMVLSLCSFASAEDYSGYTIRIYSNSNSTERTNWLINEAKNAGFTISIDDNSVISGDTAAIQAANENKDGDILFGLNETRWSQVINGTYENLSIMDWNPDWAEEVGEYKYDGKAYGLVIQNVLMLYRNDELGTNGTELHFDHRQHQQRHAVPLHRSHQPCRRHHRGRLEDPVGLLRRRQERRR